LILFDYKQLLLHMDISLLPIITANLLHIMKLLSYRNLVKNCQE